MQSEWPDVARGDRLVSLSGWGASQAAWSPEGPLLLGDHLTRPQASRWRRSKARPTSLVWQQCQRKWVQRLLFGSSVLRVCLYRNVAFQQPTSKKGRMDLHAARTLAWSYVTDYFLLPVFNTRLGGRKGRWAEGEIKQHLSSGIKPAVPKSVCLQVVHGKHEIVSVKTGTNHTEVNRKCLLCLQLHTFTWLTMQRGFGQWPWC